MPLHRLVVGPLGVNCFVLSCTETKEAVVVDPGDHGPKILAEIRKLGLQIHTIINTHGHFDHIGANGFLKTETGAELCIHEADQAYLGCEQKMFGITVFSPPADRLLHAGDTISYGNKTLQLIHTPGHTPGGICLLGEDGLLSGDTLFEQGIGRSDFPGGNELQLLQSIQEKLMVLPDELVVYPGHGRNTTIGQERQSNPFLR